MTLEQQMDNVTERVIKLEARTDRHGDALTALEQAARDSERKIGATADQLQQLITTGKTAIWIGCIVLVASQSGLLAALKFAFGV